MKQFVGATDRHMGYRAGYGDGPFPFPSTCRSPGQVFLPLVLGY